MTYKLYVYGAAFGLPSIDPECLAAICYLKATLSDESWAAVETVDPSQVTSGDLPFLRNQTKSIHGFNNIARYIDEHESPNHTHRLRDNDAAKLTSLIAHIRLYATPLLDAHLYTTSDNFIHTTRPAYTRILSPLANLTLPHQRLAAAQRRTAPLGLSKAVVPDDKELQDAQQQRDLTAVTSTSPSLLFRQNKSIRDALRQEQIDTKFRVEAILEDLCTPLAVLLDRKEDGTALFINQNGKPILSKVDCLLFGYLALILYPTARSAWIAETLLSKHGAVASYVDAIGSSILKQQFSRSTTEEASSRNTPIASIPVAQPSAHSWQSSTGHIIHSLFVSAINNIVSPKYRYIVSLDPKSPYIFGTAGAFLTAFVASVSFAYSRFWPAGAATMVFGREKTGLASLGEAGALLGALR